MSDPFSIATRPIKGMAREHDERPFRFQSQLEQERLLTDPARGRDVCIAIWRRYEALQQWRHVSRDDWFVGIVLELCADRGVVAPDWAMLALVHALGVTAHALRMANAYRAIKLEAVARAEGPTRTMGEIAKQIGVDDRTLFSWKTSPTYERLLHRAVDMALNGEKLFVGRGGIPDVVDEWLAPDLGADWHFEVDEVAQEVIWRAKRETGRLVSADIRRAMFHMFQWHANEGHVPSQTVLKALAYSMRLVDPRTGEKRDRRAGSRRFEAMAQAASMEALAEVEGRPRPSVKGLARRLGVSRPVIDAWQENSELYNALRISSARAIRQGRDRNPRS